MQKRLLLILIALAIFIPITAFAGPYNENSLECTNLPPLCPSGEAAAIVGQTNSIPPECTWECQPTNDTNFSDNTNLNDYNYLSQDTNLDANYTTDTSLISSSQENTCDWCKENNNCYELDYRLNGKYCSTNGTFEPQKETDSFCENNSECKTNLCVESKCTEANFFNMIFNLIKKFFEGIFNYGNTNSATNPLSSDTNTLEEIPQLNPPTCTSCIDEGKEYLCTFIDNYKACAISTQTDAKCTKCPAANNP